MRPLEGIELRDAIAEDYRKAAQRSGREVPQEGAERLAAADLELVDKAEALEPPRPVRAPADEPRKTRKAEQLEQELAARGDRLVRREIVDEAVAIPGAGLSGVRLEKYRARMRRLAQILETEPVKGQRFLALGDRPFKHKGLALDYLTEHADFTWSRRGYRGLSEVDRDRKFARAIEDLCDRSTAVLGPWWVR